MEATSPQCIRIVVPGIPVGQPRVKATVRNGHAAVYTPETVVDSQTGKRRKHPIVQFKSDVRLAAHQWAGSGPLMECPVRVEIAFYFPRTKGQTWKKKPMPRMPHTARPDLDNCQKAVLDALTSVVWKDDAQVYAASVEKWVCSGDESPRTEITVKGGAQ